MSSRVYIFLLIFCAAFYNYSTSQTLDPSRATDWSLAGSHANKDVDYPVINFIEEGGVPDGATENYGVFSSILSSLGNDPAVIYFPAGEYYFTQGLQLRSNLILRGENAGTVNLKFDLGGTGDLIRASGSQTGTSSILTSDGLVGETEIEVADGSLFETGSFILVLDDDDSLVTSDWAPGSTGQIIEITGVSGQTLQLRSPLRRNFYTSHEAAATLLNEKSGIGIENLTITRLDASENQTSNIAFTWVNNCWINCIQSYNSNFAHVVLRSCANVEVAGCYFQDGFAYGGGGQGYGTALQTHTSECLVTENIFKHLRHSMLVQAGSNGNVLSYNYSINPYWTEPIVPANSAGDLVLHGNYPYLNLFEGNTVQNIVIDNSHGKNGPYNTFFRNRAKLYGIVMSSPNSNMQNFIGNEVTNNNLLMGLYTLTGSGHFEHGNNVRGNIIPGGTNNLPEESLYLGSPLPYHAANSSWPPIGIPNSLNQHKIEAEIRYNASDLTDCLDDILSGITDGWIKELRIFPNPAANQIQIPDLQPGSAYFISVTDMKGDCVISGKSTSAILDVTSLQSGIYVLRIEDKNGYMFSVRFIKY